MFPSDHTSISSLIMYFDDGESLAYKSGDFLRVQFTFDRSTKATRASILEGSFKPEYKSIKWVICGGDETVSEFPRL